MRPDELARSLQAHYGAQGKIVYDRTERWEQEHRLCTVKHTMSAVGSSVVQFCPPTDSVLVPSDWEIYGRSKCGRCTGVITDVAKYLDNDFLCDGCAGVNDAEYAASIVAAERMERHSATLAGTTEHGSLRQKREA